MFSKILGTSSGVARIPVACNTPPCSLLNFGSSFKPCFVSRPWSGFPAITEFPISHLFQGSHHICSTCRSIYLSLHKLPHLVSITQIHHDTNSMEETVHSYTQSALRGEIWLVILILDVMLEGKHDTLSSTNHSFRFLFDENGCFTCMYICVPHEGLLPTETKGGHFIPGNRNHRGL